MKTNSSPLVPVVLVYAMASCSFAGIESAIDGEPLEGEIRALRAGNAWQQAGYDQHHTGFNPGETIITSENVASLVPTWASTTGERPGVPIVGSGRVYVGSLNKTLYAFNAKTGKRRWRAFADSPIATSPVAIYGKVFFVSSNGTLYAVESLNGTELWTADLGGTVSGRASPIVANNTLYVLSTGGLFAFSTDGCGAPSCAPLWKGDVIPGQATTPVVGKDLVFATGEYPSDEDEEALYAFPVGGCGEDVCEPVWVHRPGDFPLQSPSYARGRVYLPTESGLLSIFESDGRRRWFELRTAFGITRPAVVNHMLYTGTQDGLFALDERTGSIIWRGLPGTTVSPPSLAGDLVFVVGGSPKSLHVFHVDCGSGAAATCTPLLTSEKIVSGGAQAIVADGMVYIGNARERTVQAFALPPK